MRSFRADEVLRTLAAWKFALSNTMRFVDSGDRAVQTADHARDRDGSGVVCDHEIRGVELVRLVVQRDDASRLGGAANDDAAVQLVGVESVHRLRDLCHDVSSSRRRCC